MGRNGKRLVTFPYEPLFEPKEHPVETRPDGVRHYNINGNVYPSVTTMLGATSDKTYLLKWAERLKAKGIDPDQEKQRCADRGTHLHTAVERYLKNDPEYLKGLPQQTSILFNQIRMQLNQIRKVQLQEVILYSNILKLAGRVDIVADDTVIDIKGSNNVKKDEFLTDYKHQVTTYCMMLMEMTGKPITKFKIILASENYGCQIINGDMRNHMGDLVARVKRFQSQT